MMAVSRVVPCCLHSVPGCIKNTDTAFPLNCCNGGKTHAEDNPPVSALSYTAFPVCLVCHPDLMRVTADFPTPWRALLVNQWTVSGTSCWRQQDHCARGKVNTNLWHFEAESLKFSEIEHSSAEAGNARRRVTFSSLDGLQASSSTWSQLGVQTRFLIMTANKQLAFDAAPPKQFRLPMLPLGVIIQFLCVHKHSCTTFPANTTSRIMKKDGSVFQPDHSKCH